MDENQQKLSHQIATYILQERVSELRRMYEQKEERDLELFKEIANNHKELSERLLAVEENQKHLNMSLIKLQQDTSFQNRLLSAILLTIISSVIGYALKLYFG